MSDYFEHARRMDHVRSQESEGNVADSMDVRLAIVARIKSGEMSLQEGQAELRRIQRKARQAGLITRAQAYRGRAA